MAHHRGAALWRIKKQLVKDFHVWCDEREVKDPTEADVIEYLLQKNFIQGKDWLEYIDNMPSIGLVEGMLESCQQFLREGYIPPNTVIGYRK